MLSGAQLFQIGISHGCHTGLLVNDAGPSDVHTHAIKSGGSVMLSAGQGCQICCASPRTITSNKDPRMMIISM